MAEFVDNRPNLQGLDVNLSRSNQWFALLPLENILGLKYKNITLHLTGFSIPLIEMGSMEVSFKGYSKEMPTKVINSASKLLTLEYLVDDKWRNYKSLYSWMCNVEGNITEITDDKITEKIAPSDYIPLHIYLLDNYKHKIIEFVFENTWIKVFNDIRLEQNNQDVITHSFTIAYDRFTISDL